MSLILWTLSKDYQEDIRFWAEQARINFPDPSEDLRVQQWMYETQRSLVSARCFRLRIALLTVRVDFNVARIPGLECLQRGRRRVRSQRASLGRFRSMAPRVVPYRQGTPPQVREASRDGDFPTIGDYNQYVMIRSLLHPTLLNFLYSSGSFLSITVHTLVGSCRVQNLILYYLESAIIS